MMNSRKLMNYLVDEPFRPFRINLPSGKAYDIRHPEMISIGKTTAHVYTWLDDDDGSAKERQHEVSILLIESIELLDKVTSNGQQEASQ